MIDNTRGLVNRRDMGASQGGVLRLFGWQNLILAWANESLEQLVEIRSRRFNEDPAVTPDRNGPVTPTVSPSLLRDPVHLAQLREGAC
jgi:hypothetical protein